MWMTKYILLVWLLAATAAVEAQSDCPANQSFPLGTDTYLLSVAAISPLNAFDGPKWVTNIPSVTNDLTWDEADLEYYNAFSASMYCPSIQDNDSLDCCLCGGFNSTVTEFAVVQNSTTDALAFVTLHPLKGEIVVTFRGSVGLTNWILNLVFVTDTVHPGVKVHEGFYICLMSVYEEVVDAASTALLAHPSFRVVVNGHSLGGAMASLFVYFVSSRAQFGSNTPIALVTYGQPRVGNKAYVDYMNALGIPMARVVSRADIVPHLNPVTTMTLLSGTRYMHHTQEVWSNGPSPTFCSRNVYEDWSCSNSLGPAYTIVDHLQYLNLDYSVCYFVNGNLDEGLISIPGIPPPSSLLPTPVPPTFYVYGAEVEHVVWKAVVPLAG